MLWKCELCWPLLYKQAHSVDSSCNNPTFGEASQKSSILMKGPVGFAASKQWEESTSLHAVSGCRSTAVPPVALVTLQGNLQASRELWDVPVCSQDRDCGK